MRKRICVVVMVLLMCCAFHALGENVIVATVMVAGKGDQTFTDYNDAVEYAVNEGDATIRLEADWLLNEDISYGSILREGKTITFDFNGHWINGLNKTRAFTLEANPNTTTTFVDPTGKGGIQNCTSSVGGAIYMIGGTVIWKGGTIRNCSSTDVLAGGGAVCVDNLKYSVIGTKPLFMMEGGRIENCSALALGGAVYTTDSKLGSEDETDDLNDEPKQGMIMRGGTITGCTASTGGAVYSSDSFYMSGGVIEKCKAKNLGGGLCVGHGCNAKILGGEIQNCTSENAGGAIYVHYENTTGGRSPGNLYLLGGTITGNHAKEDGGGVYMNQGKLFLAGKVVVKDNTTQKNSEPSNIFISGDGFITSGSPGFTSYGNGLEEGSWVGFYSGNELDAQISTKFEGSPGQQAYASYLHPDQGMKDKQLIGAQDLDISFKSDDRFYIVMGDDTPAILAGIASSNDYSWQGQVDAATHTLLFKIPFSKCEKYPTPGGGSYLRIGAQIDWRGGEMILYQSSTTSRYYSSPAGTTFTIYPDMSSSFVYEVDLYGKYQRTHVKWTIKFEDSDQYAELRIKYGTATVDGKEIPVERSEYGLRVYTVLAGSKIVLSPETKEGYEFTDWESPDLPGYYPQLDLTQEHPEFEMPGGTVRAKARYQEEDPNYTVIYDAAGGEQAPSPQIESKQQDLVLSSQVPIRTGCLFVGWGLNKESEVVYHPGDTYTGRKNLTLYAQWEEQLPLYTVTYNANGGTGAPDMQTQLRGNDLQLSYLQPVRADFTFEGWALDPSATTASYQPGQMYYGEKTITLYAVWRGLPKVTDPDPVEITLPFGTSFEGIVAALPDTTTARWEEWKATPRRLPIGVKYDAAQIQQDLTQAGYDPEDIPTGQVTAVYQSQGTCATEQQVLYPYGDEVKARITFTSSDAYLALPKADMPSGAYHLRELTVDLDLAQRQKTEPGVVYYYQTGILQENEDDEEDWEMMAQSLTASASPFNIAKAGTRIAALASDEGNGVWLEYQDPICFTEDRFHTQYLYAMAVDHENERVSGIAKYYYNVGLDVYTIHYEVNGGDPATCPQDQLKTEGEPLILTSDIPTRSGMTFVGWGLNPDSEVAYYPGDVLQKDGDLILYALWKPLPPQTGDDLPLVKVTALGLSALGCILLSLSSQKKSTKRWRRQKRY